MRPHSHLGDRLNYLYRLVLERCWGLGRPMSRSSGASASGSPRRSSAAKDGFVAESLDSRVMMAVTPQMLGLQAVLTGDGAADLVLVRTNASNQLEYSTNGGSTYSADFDPATAGIQPFTVGANSRINVNLGAGDDALVLIDDSLRNRLNSTGAQLAYDGGTNTATGDRFDSPTTGALSWSLTGGNSATLGNQITLSNIEELRGGLGADTYTYSSGNASFNGNIVDPAGATTIAAPSGSMTISTLVKSAGDLTVTARDTITVSATGRVSTRRVSSVNDPVTGVSFANSSNISFAADSIVVSSGAVITAAASSGFVAGDVTLSASERFASPLSVVTFSTRRADVTIAGSVMGEDIYVSATASDEVSSGALGRIFNNSTDNDPSDGVDETAGFQITELLGEGVSAVVAGTIPLMVMRKSSGAMVQLDPSARVTATGNVVMSAGSISSASYEMNTPVLAIAYGRAESNAQVLLRAGAAVSGTNVTISSDAISTANVDTETNTALGTFPQDPLRVAIALAISSTSTVSRTTVELGADITATGGSANIDANGAGNSQATAESGTFSNGRAGIAIGLSFATSDIAADVAGRVISTGAAGLDLPFTATGVSISGDTINLGVDHDLRTGQPVKYTAPSGGTAIDGLEDGEVYYIIRVPGDQTRVKLAESAEKAFAGEALDLATTGSVGSHSLTPELTQGVGVRATMASENASEASGGFGAGASSLNRDLLYGDVDAADLVGHLAQRFNGAAAADGRSNANTTFAAAGALALSDVTNSVNATIRRGAELASGNDLDVKSALEERFQSSCEATVDSTDQNTVSTAISAAVIVGLYDNTSRAEVMGGTRLDAAGLMTIDSTITYPFLTTPRQLLNSLDFVAKSGSLGEFQDGLGTLMDGKLGIQSRLFNTWARSTAQATNLGISGTVTYLGIDNTSEAIVRSGAGLNRNGAPSANQAVSVHAGTSMDMVNMDGIFAIDITDESLANLRRAGDRWSVLNPAGNAGAKGGVGGSAFIQELTNNTTAKIEGGARVTVARGQILSVTATDELFNFALIQSGGSAKKFGVSGSFGLTNNTFNVLAQIDSGVTIDGGRIEIHATSELNQLIALGSTQRGGNLGVGATVGINDTTRTTQAVLGSLDGVTPTLSFITTTRGIDVAATSKGNFNVFSVAAAQTTQPVPPGPGQTPDTPPPAQDDDPLDGESLPVLFGDGAPTSAGSGSQTFGEKGQQGRSGIAISGDVAIHEMTDTVKAYINTGGTISGIASFQTYSVTAENTTNVVAASGSVALAGNSGTSAGIAGSLGTITLNGTTKAFMAGRPTVGSSASGFDYVIDAKRSGTIAAGAAGGAGAPSNGGIAISGSVTLLTINDTTEASLRDGLYADGNQISITARDDSKIIGVAGSLAHGGRAGVGAAIAKNSIRNTTRATVESGASLEKSSLKVEAVNNSDIISVAGSVGIGRTVGAAGTVAINSINNTTEALILNSSQYAGNAGADFSTPTLIRAADTSDITSVAGAVGASQNVGFGGALAYNRIGNTTLAASNNSNLIAVRGGSILAESAGTITSIAAAGAGSRNTALAGAVTINQITSTTEAKITGGRLDQNGSTAETFTIKAADTSSIDSLAGAVAGGGNNSLGASVGTDLVRSTVNAGIDGTAVRLNDWNLRVEANSTADIDSIVIGGSGAGSYAGGGAVAVNTIADTVNAGITGGANVSARDIVLKAADVSTIDALAGGVAGAGTGAIGAAIGLNDVGNVVRAEVNASNVTAVRGDVAITADELAKVNAVTAAGAGAGSFALGGSISVTSLHNTTEALVKANSVVLGGDSVLISASDDLRASTLAGTVAGAGTAAAGISASVLISNDTTQALVQGSRVAGNTAAIGYNGVNGYSGQRDSAGDRGTQTYNGVAIVAASFERFNNVAAGAAGGGSAGVAGSVSTESLNETTLARIDDRSDVDTNPAAASPGGDVTVLAVDRTESLGIGGTIAAGGTGGIGAGAEASSIVKSTEANIGGAVDAARNAIVQAVNSEEVTSVGGAVGAGGSGAVAGAANIGVYNVTTRASINDADPLAGGTTVVRAIGNVLVSADHSTTVNMIAGSASASGAGSLGASMTLPIITETTEAFIGRAARVDALAFLDSIAVADGSFTQSVVAESADRQVQVREGQPATVTKPQVRPPSVGSDVTTSLAGGQLRSTPGTTLIKGVGVSAINRNDLEAASASGAAAGSLSVALAGSATVVGTTTRAFVDNGAIVNSEIASIDQSVMIAAGSDLYHLGIAGSAAFSGAVGAAPGVDVVIATNTVQAFIEDNAQVKAAKDLSVRAMAQEELLSVGAGLSATGLIAVSGSLAMFKLTDVTQAYIGNFARVTARTVQLLAEDDTDSTLVAGAGALGLGGGGLAASVGLNLITKTTQALVEADADVVGTAQIGIRAQSTEILLGVTASGAGGAVGGLAGAALVNILQSDTTAAVLERAKINPSTRTTTPGAVTVAASNSLRLKSFGGALAGGLYGGLAGTIDLGIVRGNTTVRIAPSANVTGTTVSVTATAVRAIDSTIASVGGGAVGLSGSISIYTLGAPLDSNSLTSITSGANSVSTFVDSDVVGGVNSSISGLLGGYSSADRNGTDPAPDATSVLGSTISAARTGLSNVNQSTSGAAINSTTPRGETTVSVDDGAIVTYTSLNLRADETDSFNGIAGAAAVGVLAVGGSVIIVNNNANVSARLSGTLSGSIGFGTTSVVAVLNETMDGLAFAGSGGALALGAQYVALKDASNVGATVAPGANFLSGNALILEATSNRDLDADAIGGAIGGAALGLSLASADLAGSAKARILPGARFNNNLLGAVTVVANSTAIANAEADAVTAGILSGSGADASASSTPAVEASIGAGIRLEGLRASSDVNIRANSNAKDVAYAKGRAIGALGGLGISRATATTAPTVDAFIGAGAVVNADSLFVQASENIAPSGDPVLTNGASATAESAGGGRIGGLGGALASAVNIPAVRAQILTGSDINCNFALAVGADAANPSSAVASGSAVSGVISVGASIASATSSGITKAFIGANTTIDTNSAFAGSRARAIDTADARAVAAAGGLVAVGINSAASTVSPTVSSETGENVDVNAHTFLNFRADSEVHSTAQSLGLAAGLVSNVGTSSAAATATPNVRTAIGSRNDLIAKTGQAFIETTINYSPFPTPVLIAGAAQASTTASVVGLLFAGAEATSTTVTSNLSATTDIGPTSTLVGGRDIAPGSNSGVVRIRADVGNDTSNSASSTTGGLFTRAGTLVTTNTNTIATVNIQDSDRLQSSDRLWIVSNAVTNARAAVTGGGGNTITSFLSSLFTNGLSTAFSNPPSLLSSGASMAVMNINTAALATIGNNTQLVATDIEAAATAATLVDARATMRSSGTFAAEATSLVLINGDSDASLTVGTGAVLSAQRIVLSADNGIGAVAVGRATTGASVANADSTGITRVNFGATGSSDAIITLSQGSSLTAQQSVTITSTVHQLDPLAKLNSEAVSTADGGFIASARSLADGTVNATSRIVTSAGSTIIAPSTTIRGRADDSTLQMDRKPIASATTISSRFVQRTRQVTDRIVQWLPWPFSEIVRFVVRTITDLVEVFDFSTATGTQGGSGVRFSNTFTNGGTITNQVPANRRLTIDAGPRRGGGGPSTDNMTYHTEPYGIVVDPVANEGHMHVTIDFDNGTIEGDGEIKVNAAIHSLEITSFNDSDLYIGDLEMVIGERNASTVFEPEIDMHSAAGSVRINRDIERARVVIRDNGRGNVILTQPLQDVSADISIIAAGNILLANGAFIESGSVGELLLQAGGDIGTAAAPVHVRSVRGQVLPAGEPSTTPALIRAVSGGRVCLDITGENEVFHELPDGPDTVDTVDGIDLEVAARGDIRINISDTEILDDHLIAHAANGVYDLIDVHSTEGNVCVLVARGDLRVGSVMAAGEVTLSASRDILTGDPSELVEAQRLAITAGGSVGSPSNPLRTRAAALLVDATSGSIDLHNIGSVEVQGLHGSGTVTATATGTLTLTGSVTAGADVILRVEDSQVAGEDLHVVPTATISSGGGITLDAGDGVQIDTGASLAAIGELVVSADFDGADISIGGSIAAAGSIRAAGAAFMTGEDNDTIDLHALVLLDGTTVKVASGTGDDQVTGSADSEIVDLGAGRDTFRGGGGADVVNPAELTDAVLSDSVTAGQTGSTFRFAMEAGNVATFGTSLVSGDAALEFVVVDELGNVLATAPNGLPLSFEAPSTGVYSVIVTAGTGQGTYVLSAQQHPRVTSVVINHAQVQRDNLESVAIGFDGPVNFTSLIESGRIADVVRLFSTDTGIPVTGITSNRFTFDAAARVLTLDLTIDGPGGNTRTVMADGYYQVRIDLPLLETLTGDSLHAPEAGPGGILVLDRSTGAASPDLYRLALDVNGDGVINADDLGDFITSFFSSSPSDFNHDGNFDPDDLADLITLYFMGR